MVADHRLRTAALETFSLHYSIDSASTWNLLYRRRHWNRVESASDLWWRYYKYWLRAHQTTRRQRHLASVTKFLCARPRSVGQQVSKYWGVCDACVEHGCRLVRSLAW